MSYKHFFYSLTVFITWTVVFWWVHSKITEQKDTTVHEVKPKKVIQKLEIDSITIPIKVKEIDLDLIAQIRKLSPRTYIKKSVLDSVYNYMLEHSNQELTIESFYNSKEKENPSIGEKRAEYTKRALLSNLALDEGRITTTTKDSNFVFSANRFDKGIRFLVKEMAKEKIDSLKQNIEHKSIQSSFSSSQFIPDKAFNRYIEILKVYLSKYPTKKITITGHTDNIGEEVDNEWIGLERAKAVKKYLVRKGIDKKRVTPVSKGETAPIADNTTRQGRRKNRRIEIKVYD